MADVASLTEVRVQSIGGEASPQTLQLPRKNFWPVTNIEVTTILGLTLFKYQC